MKTIFLEKPEILKDVEKHNFKVFEMGEMNINIIGTRHPNQIPDIFNDYLHILWKENDTWIQYKFTCTLDPGIYFLNSPMRKDGTAIIKHPQQIRAGLKIGYHKGQYKCLVQNKPFQVWRDNNKDDEINEFIDSVSMAIQIHRASPKFKAQRIHNWSAGCTVIQDPKEYDIFMSIVEQSIEKNPTWKFFTYTIIQGVYK